MNKLAFVFVAAAVCFVSGCASTLHNQERAAVRSDAGKIEDAKTVIAAQPSADYHVSDGVFLGTGDAIALPVNDGSERLLAGDVSMDRGYMMTLPQIAERLQAAHNVRVTVTADALVAAAAMPRDPFEGEVTGAQALGLALTAGAGPAGPAGATGSSGAIRVAYTGSLRGFLDHVTSLTGTYWEWSNGGILIGRWQTRTYRIAAIPGSTSLTGRLGSTSASGGAGGGGDAGGATSATSSDQETTMQAEVEVIESVAEAVNTMLSDGGRVAVAAGMGIITVTDVPSVQVQVKQFIDQVNEIATRQANVDVQVVAVDLNDVEAYGIDWTIVRESLNGRTAIDLFSGGEGIPQGANSAGFAVIDPTYNYAGSSVLLQALETQGRVRVANNAQISVLTNAPAPINIVDEVSYLKELKTTVVPVSGAVQVELTPGVVSSGFSMQLLPVILDNNEILLQFGTSISSLRELRTVTSGPGANAGRIEVPSLSKRDTLQRVKLRSGQTLALWGFEQERSRGDSRGNGLASFIAGGGSVNTNKNRTVFVILVTPRVLA